MEQILMAGHEPEKGEVASPVERLHDDIRKAHGTPIQRDISSEHKEEKQLDCTDQLLECTSECDPNDKECEDECVEEYKECEYPWEKEVDADPDLHIVDPNQPWDKLVEYPVVQQGSQASAESYLMSEISHIATLLRGKITKSSTTDKDGKESKKIIIEYDVR
tara:strand:+ start:140 stop:628 length:489 start_codon:yes stop_codon:yes gene_type:complete